MNARRDQKTEPGVVTTFISRDIDEVSERLVTMTGASTRVDYFGKPQAFRMSVTAAKLGCLLLSKNQVASWSATRVMGGLTQIMIPVAGSPLRYRCGTRSYEVGVGDPAAVGRPFEEVQAKRLDGAALMLHAPIEALIERAEQLTAGPLSGSPVSRMTDRVDLRGPAGEAFARALRTTFTEFVALNSAGVGPLVIAGYEDILTNLAAASLFPSIVPGLDRQTVLCGPATIRRARDFIEAHASEPLKIAQLAADLGLPMRTLQDNFQRLFGHSPRAWLLECRLENARQRLALPVGATSVSRVAYECGFGDLSGFSARYRKRYGEAPSETLRVGRRLFA
jgi:AraC-like DNA-binding protein